MKKLNLPKMNFSGRKKSASGKTQGKRKWYGRFNLSEQNAQLIKVLVIILVFTVCLETVFVLGRKGVPVFQQIDYLAHKSKYDREERERQEAEELRLAEEQKEQKITSALDKAKTLASGYGYNDAVELLKNELSEYKDDPRITQAISEYESGQSQLAVYDGPVVHIFFHSLIADTAKAFDGDAMEAGYNAWMTTVDEFNAMMEQMYANGFILIDIHDTVKQVTDENGKTVYEKAELYLPQGKKPFVLSQDDVNYYEYMEDDGFAQRIVIDEDGWPACVYKNDDGTETIARDYDVVPLLEKFIQEHPDFSYKGARGIIAETGYEGSLGYRTDDPTSPTYAQDVEQATAVANRLKELGWTFASHSWGHGHQDKMGYDAVLADAKRWAEEVQPIVGATDVYIYPYGEEIDYNSQKLPALQEMGFNFFCGVWTKPFLEVNDTYVRQTRHNLDGYTMANRPESCEGMFDVESVWDSARPTKNIQ